MMRWGYGLKQALTFLPIRLYEERARRMRMQHPLLPPTFLPQDHQIHGTSSAEWWYFTGVLTTPARQRPVGFEVTFFRVRWGAESRFLHTAVSDITRGTFTTKGAAWGIYPIVRPTPPGVVSLMGNTLSFDEENGEMRIQTKAGQVAIDLRMKAGAVMAQGDGGMIDMTRSSHASCYYSLPDMTTAGTIRLKGETLPVTGVTWHDHQWGDFSVQHLAWDWFSLRLDGGLAVMVFAFPDKEGKKCSGNAHGPAGTRVLDSAHVSSRRLFRTRDGITYPLEWDITVSAPGGAYLAFHVKPMFDGQYIISFSIPSYWEGLCTVEGTVLAGGELAGVWLKQDESLTGTAYVELTGYETLRSSRDKS